MPSNTKGKPYLNNNSKFERSESLEKQKSDIDPHLEDKVLKNVDDNLSTLQKIHAILLNCVNLTRKQKSEFAESERFFMKLYLKKLVNKLRNL